MDLKAGILNEIKLDNQGMFDINPPEQVIPS